MSTRENILLTDVAIFLKETLSSETLSVNANRQRLALLLKLSSYLKDTNTGSASDATDGTYADVANDSSLSAIISTNESSSSASATARPFSYAETNGNCSPIVRNEFDAGQSVECYEELESNSEWSGCSSNFSRNYNNTSLYSSENRQNNHHRLSFSSRSDSSSRNNNNNNNNINHKVCPPEAVYENTCSNNDRLAEARFGGRSTNINGGRRDISPTSSSKYCEGPTTDVSLTMLRCSAIKFGQLYRREKIIFVEHVKKYWAALLGTVLYTYSSEKDNKPSTVINVDDYKARPIKVGSFSNSSSTNGSTNGKKDFGFEIVCPGRKTYQFYACSKMDMEIWITCINHSLPIPQQQMFNASAIKSVQSSCSSCPNIVDANSRFSICNGLASNKENGHCYGANKPPDVGKQQPFETTVDRRLPSIPSPTLYEHYDKPNPVVRPVTTDNCLPSVFLNGKTNNSIEQETFYHSIEESESRYDYPTKKECYYTCPESVSSSDNGGGSVYYNTTPSVYSNHRQNNNEQLIEHRCDGDKKKDINDDDCHQTMTKNNDDDHQTEVNVCEAIYDGVAAEEEKENFNNNNNIGAGRIQQIIQQIEEISQRNGSGAANNKKISPLSNRQSKLIVVSNNGNITAAAPIRDEIYELVSSPSPAHSSAMMIIKGKV